MHPERSSSRKASIRSFVAAPPLLGNGRNPNTESVSGDRPPPDSSIHDCRPGPDIPFPKDCLCRRGSSLAVSRTSSSIPSVVHMRLMPPHTTSNLQEPLSGLFFRVFGEKRPRGRRKSTVRFEAVLRRRGHTGHPRVRPKTRGSGRDPESP